MNFVNRAPKWVTILISLVLMGIGALGTFAGWFPEWIGIYAYLAATLLMLLGIALRRL